MNTAEIKDILQSNYDRNNWLRFLVYVANQNNNRLKDTLHVQDLSHQFNSNSYPISTLLRIGTYYTTDRQAIPVYEVGLKNTIRIERNRVGVNQFIKNIVLKQQGSKAALCVFKYDSSDIPEWRFSFISKFAASQFFSDVAAKETQPKRYTYIFGTPEEHRTAIQCFKNLKNSGFNIQDFFDAFSVEKVSKDFFDGYKDHYETLVDEISDITANYTTVFNNNDKAVRDFSKRLLGRIVFLYFLQKKHWLGSSTLDYKDGDPDFLFSLFIESKCTEDGSDYYLHKLTELFFDTLNRKREEDSYKTPSDRVVKVPYLNGGLFDDSSEPKGYELLIIPNWVFLRLFEFLNQYNFTIDESSPEDHTVAVDPEMLGHIFENLLEDNKDKGAFYTPKEIVHYMCQESLIEYLTTNLGKSYTVYKEMGKGQVELFGNETKTGQLSLVESIGDKALDKSEIEHIVRHKDISKLTDAQLSNMDALLDSVKICDPAIGSGAFPMGLLQEIFAIKELIAYQTQTEWNPAKVKANIIQNSIYGVDIEQGAVDIAQLRFWLSLVVDEDLPTPLPNLDYKIVTGNSLITKFNDEVIEIDWDTDTTKEGMFGQKLIEEKIDLLKDLADKQKRFFDADAKNKEKLQKAIRLLTLQVLEKQLQLTIETKGFEGRKDGKKLTKKQAERLVQTQIWKKTLQDIKALQKNNKDFAFFDWKINFSEILNPYLIKEESKRGFDIVIANPPFISHDKIREIKYLKSTYKTFEPFADIYCYFLEHGIALSKANGAICYITSNSYLRTNYGSPLRRFLIKSTAIKQLINIEDSQLFGNAIVNTSIMLASKGTFQGNALVVNSSFDFSQTLRNFILSRSFKYSASDFELMDSWTLITPDKLNILKKIKLSGKTLEQLEAKIRLGLATGSNKAFIINKLEKEELIREDENSAQIIKPVLRGRDIERYKFNHANLYLLLTKNGIDVSKYPAIYNHLASFGEKFKKRGAKGKHWTNLRACSFFDDFKKEKIIWIELSDRGRFALSTDEIYLLNSAYFLLPPKGISSKPLLAILNSKIIQFFLENTAESSGMGTTRWINNNVKEFPIPQISNQFEVSVTPIVDYILYLKGNNNQGQELNVLYFEQIIDGMVHELYFPELLQQHNRTIIEHLGELPELNDNDKNGEKNMSIINKVYDRLSHKSHPVATNLYYLNTIPEIAIIEGKSEADAY